jgi:hypothetical protein
MHCKWNPVERAFHILHLMTNESWPLLVEELETNVFQLMSRSGTQPMNEAELAEVQGQIRALQWVLEGMRSEMKARAAAAKKESGIDAETA